jgi:hypothetical protein
MGLWQDLDGQKRIRRLTGDAWRVVEAQHVIATRKLVDSDDEQRLLEEMLEGSKPPLTEAESLHYLLATPFRYPPLRHGSRFGTRLERGIWYGAREPRTAFAEVAYYRLLFLEGSAAKLEPISVDLSAFRVPFATRRGVDLTRDPFVSERGRISSKSNYKASQRLGRDMREAGVEAFLSFSARDTEDGVNVGVLSPKAFGATRPRRFETWHCTATKEAVELIRRDTFKHSSFAFRRAQFLVKGVLPTPAT